MLGSTFYRRCNPQPLNRESFIAMRSRDAKHRGSRGRLASACHEPTPVVAECDLLQWSLIYLKTGFRVQGLGFRVPTELCKKQCLVVPADAQSLGSKKGFRLGGL